MKRLFIVDPSLKDIRGHHYMMTRAATRSAQQYGFDVIWLCSAQFSGALDRENATIAPVFKATTYDAYIKQEKAAAKPSLLQRALRRLTGEQPEAAAPAPFSFYEDLKAAMSSWEINANDRVLLHTGDGESLPAVARLIEETPLGALPIFHVATPYDPVGVMPHRRNIEGFADTLERLRSADKLENRLFLYAENAYLAEHLSQLWPAPVRALPIPASAPTSGAADIAHARLMDRLGFDTDSFLIISLGSARLEKGFHLIPDIADQVFGRIPDIDGAKGRIKFVLHASPQIVGRDPRITKAIDALQARPEGEVFLLLEPLSDEDYQTLLLASDAVLLPYGENEYRVRGSAVVTEAIAAGKTLIAAADTYPGKMAQAHGGLTGQSPSDLAEAILAAYEARESLKARAARESESFIAANNMETYWLRCLDAERETGLNVD